MRPFLPQPFVMALSFTIALSPAAALAGPSTTWANFPLGAFPVNLPTVVATGGGTTVTVTVQTGGSQGVNGADLDTLGIGGTALQYTHLYCLGIFNGGGFSSVPTSLTFSNIQVGAAHTRGLLMVGAINAASSPVTVTSSVPGRVPAWTVVGTPFDDGPTNSFPVSWDAASGTITTTAASGNDSRCIVLDVGDLRNDGTITVSLNQNLNDGILYSIGEELLGALDVPGPGGMQGLLLAAPRQNPVRAVADFAFTLPMSMHVRIAAYDVRGRRLATIGEGDYGAGTHALRWDLRATAGAPAPPGLCFLRLETPAGARVQRLVILR